MKHHPFGFSSLWRRRMCRGSVYEERKYTEPADADMARLGTSLHAAVADRITWWRDHGHKGEIPCPVLEDEDLEELVSKAFDRFFGLLQHVRTGHEGEPRIYVEEVYEIREVAFEKVPVFGTPDLVVVTEDAHGYVVDWKFGWKPLVAEHAFWQVGAQCEAVRQLHKLETVYGFVVNPRLDQKVSTVVQGSDGFAEAYQGVINSSEEGRLEAGPWCEHCNAVGLCEKTQNHAEVMSTALGDVESPTKEGKRRKLADRAAKLTRDSLVRLLPVLEIAELACEAVRDRLKLECQSSPIEVDGYRWQVEEYKGRRHVTGPKLKEKFAGMLSYDEILGCANPVLSRVEQALSEKGVDSPRQVVDMLLEDAPRPTQRRLVKRKIKEKKDG